MMDKIPNFFIIGAPKCGTTALSEYLRTHLEIFISDPKEPHFFAQDITGYSCCNTESKYKEIFLNVSKNEIAVGEASVLYLYSNEAINKIYQFNQNSKIIVMLRNHVDYIYSYHSQLLLNGDEIVNTFEEAWKLELERRNNKSVPKNCRCQKLLYYRDIGRLGEQVERVLSVFPKEQIHFILMDDMKNNMRQVYLDVLTFLGVKDDGKIVFPKINENKQNKFKLLAQFRNNPPKIVIDLVKVIKKMLKLNNVSFTKKLHEMNMKTIEREPLKKEFREELFYEFKEDILKLGKLINRDLSHWK